MSQTRLDFKGQRVTLIGLGVRTHVALARYLVRHGATVTISDAKPTSQLHSELRALGDLKVHLGLGGHRDEDILSADAIFVTPGAPRDLPCLIQAIEHGIPISSEIELLFAISPAPIVGITGSSGKTTTTALVGEMCISGGRTTLVGGNIGVPLIDRIDDIRSDALIVLELSSFQLEYLKQSPKVGAILNITPNHLDRHGSFECYRAAKWNIIAHQTTTDCAVLSEDDPETRRLARGAPGQVLGFSRHKPLETGTCLDGQRLVLRLDGSEQDICNVSDLMLRGEHNIGNVLAACAVATALNIPMPAIQKAISSFHGVEHRLEEVRRLDDVLYDNDSIATSPERTVAALGSFGEPIVLIAGGRSKHLHLGEMAAQIAAKVRALVIIGEMADEIEAAIRRLPCNTPSCERASSLEQAVALARVAARPGDVVLLSPGGTSFDMFRDFEARGQHFKEIVARLESK